MTAPTLSLPLSESNETLTPTRPKGPRFPWMREPLVHFLVLGGLLFGLDRVFNRADQSHTIVVSADVDREAIETFRATRNREPTSEELTALRKVWLDNEVLYREGLALQVDKGDPAIRERVIFKALSVVDSNVKLPPIDDAGLHKWFEAHHDKYDEPARLDFEEAVLSGDSSEAAVRAFVDQLNGGASGDAKAGLRVFKGRPQANIVQSYGADVAKALGAATPGKWLALKTREGWRAIRVDAQSERKPAAFESLRGVVLQDWKDAVASEQRSAAVHALAKKYKITHELPVGEDSE